MKILYFIFKPTSWGNKSVQVRQAIIYLMCFAVITLFLNFNLINFSNAKHRKQQGSTRY